MGWESYNAYKRHPFETSTGMEGGCHHCGGPYDSVLHEQPWELPLPPPRSPEPGSEPFSGAEWLDTATYDH